MSSVVYPNASSEIDVPDSQSIAVFVNGESRCYVYQLIQAVGVPDAWKELGFVEDEETVYGPFSPRTKVRIDAGADGVRYKVGASPVISDITGDLVGTDDPFSLSGAADAQGGAVSVTGGASSTSANAGGAVSLTGGAPGATGVGGALTLTSGAGGSTSGASGAVTVASGVATAGSGSPSGAVVVQSGAGAASAAATAGGASGAVSVKSQDGGDNTGGASGEAGGSAGAVSLQSGAGGDTDSTGAHNGGDGGDVSVTAGAGGAASAGTGDGGDGGHVIITPGAGGASAGGSAGETGQIFLRGSRIKKCTPSSQAGAITITRAVMESYIVSIIHSTGANINFTLDTGPNIIAAFPDWEVGDGIEWCIVNSSAAAADTVTVVSASGHNFNGVGVIQSKHATTGGIYGSSGRFITRKDSGTVCSTWRIG